MGMPRRPSLVREVALRLLPSIHGLPRGPAIVSTAGLWPFPSVHGLPGRPGPWVDQMAISSLLTAVLTKITLSTSCPNGSYLSSRNDKM